MSSLLYQSRRAIHRVSRSTADLHVHRGMRRDGARGDDICATGGCEAGGENGAADREGRGREGRSEGDEGCEGPMMCELGVVGEGNWVAYLADLVSGLARVGRARRVRDWRRVAIAIVCADGVLRLRWRFNGGFDGDGVGG